MTAPRPQHRRRLRRADSAHHHARNIRFLYLVVGAVVVLAGCVARSGDGPDLDQAPSSTAAVSESSDPRYVDLLPPRPRELDLTDVDPCTDLLTDQQLRDLDYDLGYARPPVPGRDDIHGGRKCVFASSGGSGGVDRNVGTLISISTTEGALAWANAPARAPARRPEVANIEGFYALVLPNPILRNNCLVVVDTADGQYLDVSSGASNGKGPGPQPFCQEAQRVASLAIRTIST